MIKYFIQLSAYLEHSFYYCVYMSIVASIVGILIYGITRILKNKLSPKWVSIIWLLFIICLVVPIQFKSDFSIYNLIPINLKEKFYNISSSTSAAINYNYADTFTEEYIDTFINSALNTGDIKQEEVGQIVQDYNNDLKDFKKENSPTRLVNILPFIWGTIILTLTILYIMIYVSFLSKIKKNGKNDGRVNKILEECKKEFKIKKNIKILYQNVISMPAIFGIFKVKILVNDDVINLSDKEMSYIIKHELAHYKRKDNWLNLIITILGGIYFFNPIVFFLLGRVKKDLELATDDLAMKNTTKEEQKDYLKTLVMLSQRQPDRFVVQTLCLTDEKKNLERRIDSLKLFEKFKKNSKKIAITSTLILIILTLTCFTRSSAYMSSADMYNFIISKNNYNKSNYYIKEITYNNIDGTTTTIETYKKDNSYIKISDYTNSSSTEYHISTDGIQKDFITSIDSYGEKSLRETVIDIPISNTVENNEYYFYKNEWNYSYLGTEELHGKNCYVIKYKNGWTIPSINSQLHLNKKEFETTYWIDIETGLILKEKLDGPTFYGNYGWDYVTEYYYEFGNVTDEDIVVPDLSEYKESSYYQSHLDFYELKSEILKNSENTEQALNDFNMLENLEDINWQYSYSDTFYLLDDEFVLDLNFNNYNNDDYYKLIIRKEDCKILELEIGKTNEKGEFVVTTTKY